MQRVATFSVHFDELYRVYLPANDIEKIDDFTEHFEQYGFSGLPGKLAPTWNVPGVDVDYEAKKRFAVENYLWHYHVGVPFYQSPRNPAASWMTSEWVVHFQRFPGDMEIRLVDYDCHDPMHMPLLKYLS
ncbi:hypothetical protein [Pseudomonas sp.]|uniref:hypothetical protein n=1 Tax=Pseudomonas sp. TaxID=306 RepID=UPI0029085273|nr:hypothetical protein [Pseudomonas sp.]MDU4255788.1 hypothetical protein [Pseudomonas sp.]